MAVNVLKVLVGITINCSAPPSAAAKAREAVSVLLVRETVDSVFTDTLMPTANAKVIATMTNNNAWPFC